MDRSDSDNWTPQQCAACRASSSAAGTMSDRATGRYHRKWLSALAPGFAVRGDQVEVVRSPTAFYETLKHESYKAKRRIVLSSLYLGTGKLERELVDCLREALERSPKLQLCVLLDYTRGSRGGECSSRSMLLPLLAAHADQVRVALYHTPALRGWLRRALPERYNETVGLQHMKVYLFDDNVMMSGANLSDSYFTNRQDRYVIFRNSSRLANFFSQLVHTVSSFSLQLDKHNAVDLAKDWSIHPFEDDDDGTRFQLAARKKVKSLLSHYHEAIRVGDQPGEAPSSSVNPAGEDGSFSHDGGGESVKGDGLDTWVYPLIQMGPLGVDDDHTATSQLLHELPEGALLRLASGYFNLTDDYVHQVVHHLDAQLDVLTASPEANGFYGARGIAGAIPDAYTCILQRFYCTVCEAQQDERIQLFEYYRSGWTFHAKGMWCTLPGDGRPSITLVGSPNFGYRSRYRDLEAQVAVITENKVLQEQLEKECSSLFDESYAVTMDTFRDPQRKVPYWVSLVTTVIKRFF